MTEMRDAVQRGVALLDAKVPGWWQRIDVAELDMHECNRCVLGQMFRTATISADEQTRAYADGLSALGIVDGREFGFDLEQVGSTLFTSERQKEWGALRELWVTEIKRRFDEGFDL